MIEVIATGPQNTVQDLGRYGHRHIGVATAGAMDSLALCTGNLMLNNDPSSAAVEVQTFPLKVRFSAEGVIALTGADGRATLDGREVLPWWALPVKVGQVLEIRHPRQGARVYLCVAGGIDVPQLMGSRSTALRGGFGGLEGRPLQAGDALVAGHASALSIGPEGFGVRPPSCVMAQALPVQADGALALRAIPAGEALWFGKDLPRFWAQSWKISAQSNRTGYRLAGEPIQAEQSQEMRSYGLVPGVVQVPPGGEPIVQLSDANTAGGYPKVAGVIEADLWRLGQAAIGSRIRFVEASPREAIAADAAIAAYLAGVRRVVEVRG